MDAAALFDPGTYADGVPYDLIAEMRADASVQWVPEPAVLGWEAGPGYWAVLTHAGVNRVLRDAEPGPTPTFEATSPLGPLVHATGRHLP
jgi:hypothetical protein